jgi:hypothetical protein
MLFAAWVGASRYAAEHLESRNTFGNKMKAIANFMKIPFMPVDNLDRLQQMWAPTVENRFATESTAWLERHDPERH